MEAKPTSEETQEHFDFLLELRDSGITNMYGAAPFLEDEFPDLNRQEAQTILGAWMDSFK
tara:strand:+ start:251 stop:430 length:180 start_codon:yes stop_codon:yes gene_type:complete